MRRVLIIDDEEGFCLGIRSALQAGGDYEVLIATDGKEGLRVAQSERPDVILLDILMPGLSGFDVLKRLKEDGRTVSIPVLMLTAVTAEEAKRRTSALYDEGYIEKPVGVDELQARIERVLSRRAGPGS